MLLVLSGPDQVCLLTAHASLVYCEVAIASHQYGSTVCWWWLHVDFVGLPPFVCFVSSAWVCTQVVPDGACAAAGARVHRALSGIREG